MPTSPPTHRPSKKARSPDADRPNAYQRGYGGKAWATMRRLVYAAGNGQCTSCGRVVAGRNAHIDHIVPKALGGPDTASNLQVLCAGCHGVKTRREAQGGSEGVGGSKNENRVQDRP